MEPKKKKANIKANEKTQEDNGTDRSSRGSGSRPGTSRVKNFFMKRKPKSGDASVKKRPTTAGVKPGKPITSSAKSSAQEEASVTDQQTTQITPETAESPAQRTSSLDRVESLGQKKLSSGLAESPGQRELSLDLTESPGQNQRKLGLAGSSDQRNASISVTPYHEEASSGGQPGQIGASLAGGFAQRRGSLAVPPTTPTAAKLLKSPGQIQDSLDAPQTGQTTDRPLSCPSQTPDTAADEEVKSTTQVAPSLLGARGSVSGSRLERLIGRKRLGSVTRQAKDTVRVNVNGYSFDLPRSTCLRVPVLAALMSNRRRFHRSKLQQVPEEGQKEEEEGDQGGGQGAYSDQYFFERSHTVFAAVVDYVQNDELHLPPHVCPKLFARDLGFWGFDIDRLQPCCFPRVVHFLWEQNKLSKFHSFLRAARQVGGARKPTRCGRFRHRVWQILDEPFTSRAAKIYFYTMCLFILLSFVVIALNTVDSYRHHDQKMKSFNVASATLEQIVLHYTSFASSIYLVTDYALRFFFCPSWRHFYQDLVNVTDTLAVLSSIVRFVLEQAHIAEEGNLMLEAVNILQFLRILRLLRPMSKMTGFRLIYFTLKCSFQELTLVFMLLIFLTMIFSSLLYYLGDQGSIQSIPHAMWFSLTTMTTIGYGDIIPEKARTKVIGSVVAVFGVIMMSMTMPIMVSNFNSLYVNAVVGQPLTLKKARDEAVVGVAATFHEQSSPSINKLKDLARYFTSKISLGRKDESKTKQAEYQDIPVIDVDTDGGVADDEDSDSGSEPASPARSISSRFNRLYRTSSSFSLPDRRTVYDFVDEQRVRPYRRSMSVAPANTPVPPVPPATPVTDFNRLSVV